MLEELTVADAAARLGITPETCRKRAQRGQLAGRKVGGQWRVYLDDGAGQQDSNAGQRDKTPGQPDNSAGQMDNGAVVAELRARVAFLEEALLREQSNVQVALMRALPAPTAEASTAPSEPRRRRWWWPWGG